MPAKPGENNLKMLSAWEGRLGCPACHGALNCASDRVTCASCGRVYPVEDGIPVLIVERATRPSV